MTSLIVVHPDFDRMWPFAADHFHALWQAQGEVEFVRLEHGDERCLGEAISICAGVRRLACFGVTATRDCLQPFTDLQEAVFERSAHGPSGEQMKRHLEEAGVTVYRHTSVEFWGQCVAEFALALTLCGLRRIPQLHHEILTSQDSWNYNPPDGVGRPGGPQLLRWRAVDAA